MALAEDYTGCGAPLTDGDRRALGAFAGGIYARLPDPGVDEECEPVPGSVRAVYALSHRGMTAAVFRALCRACCTNRSAAMWWVSEPGLPPALLADGLACVLARNPVIHDYAVNLCCLDVQGWARIGRALGRNTALRVLNLSGTPLPAAAARQLAQGIAGGAFPLEELLLNDTGLDDDGVLALAPALETQERLHTLELLRNAVGRRGERALQQLAARHPALVRVRLWGTRGVQSLPDLRVHYAGTTLTCAADDTPA